MVDNHGLRTTYHKLRTTSYTLVFVTLVSLGARGQDSLLYHLRVFDYADGYPVYGSAVSITGKEDFRLDTVLIKYELEIQLPAIYAPFDIALSTPDYYDSSDHLEYHAEDSTTGFFREYYIKEYRVCDHPTFQPQVEFEPNDSIISFNNKNGIVSIMCFLVQYPNSRIQIKGYECPTIDNTLTQNRVNSVYNALVHCGINPDRLEMEIDTESKCDGSQEELKNVVNFLIIRLE